MNCIICGASISIDTDGNAKCHNCGAYYSRETMERMVYPLLNAIKEKPSKETDLLEDRLLRIKRNEKAVPLLSVIRHGYSRRAYCVLPDGTCQCLSKSIGFNRDEQDILNEVLKWRGIIALAQCSFSVFGLKDDGTVAVADPKNFHKEVKTWKDIIAISASGEIVAGLRADGTIVLDCDRHGFYDSPFLAAEYWKGIKKISVGSHDMSGIRSDGTIATTRNYSIGFKNIIDISEGIITLAALDENGHVHLSDSTYNGEKNCKNWNDIISVSFGDNYILGLKADGTVVAEGKSSYGRCEVHDWKGIIAVFAGVRASYGIKEDGTIVATAEADHSELKKIKLFDDPNKVGIIDPAKRAERAEKDKKEREKLVQQKKLEREKAKLKQEKAALVEEYSQLSPIFNKRRRSEIELSLNEINNRLRQYD